jgi:PTS system fructose-specific IIC component
MTTRTIAALRKLQQQLLTGVSHAIPFIACGGILIAIGIAFVPMGPSGPDFSNASPLLQLVERVGGTAFALLLPVLAGYIGYAIAGRPALVPGFVGGHLAGEIRAGFLGALVIGLVAGYLTQGLKSLRVPAFLKPVMPILVIPTISALAVGALMLLVLGPPIARLMAELGEALRALSDGNAVVLALVLGGMIAFDMGGPVNKAAFFFSSAMIQEGHFAAMGACAAAICTPPLGMGLATWIDRRRWSAEEREAGTAALTMGTMGITEGAIPFAAADPLRIIPCIMAGSMCAAVIAMLGGVGNPAPHGGLIVLAVVEQRGAYLLAIAAGTLLTALLACVLRRLARRAAESVDQEAA